MVSLQAGKMVKKITPASVAAPVIGKKPAPPVIVPKAAAGKVVINPGAKPAPSVVVAPKAAPKMIVKAKPAPPPPEEDLYEVVDESTGQVYQMTAAQVEQYNADLQAAAEEQAAAAGQEVEAEPAEATGTVTMQHPDGTEESEDHALGQMLVSKPHSSVFVKMGITKNLGNYEFFRCDIAVSVPCDPDEESLNNAYAFGKAWADEKINEVNADITAQLEAASPDQVG